LEKGKVSMNVIYVIVLTTFGTILLCGGCIALIFFLFAQASNKMDRFLLEALLEGPVIQDELANWTKNKYPFLREHFFKGNLELLIDKEMIEITIILGKEKEYGAEERANSIEVSAANTQLSITSKGKWKLSTFKK
jgi:hypothetical protein